MVSPEQRELLRADSLGKYFGQQQVLTDISFSVYPGEILGLSVPTGLARQP